MCRINMLKEGCASARVTRKRRFAEDVHKFLRKFSDVKYDGV